MTQKTLTDKVSRAEKHHTAGTVFSSSIAPLDTFARRHVGSGEEDIQKMLTLLGVASLDELVEQTVPASIRLNRPLNLRGLPPKGESPLGEQEVLQRLGAIAAKNKVFRSFIGMGYYDTITPGVIQRNILENPAWYTQYTPYQAEISQGRLEALLNFQTMVADLTGLPLANASLLDEATAAAEAMAMCQRITPDRNIFLVADHCHPQTIAVMQTRAEPIGIELRMLRLEEIEKADAKEVCGVLVQYPTTDGEIIAPERLNALAQKLHDGGAMLAVATDLLALTLIVPPGEFGADIAIGSAQRFGVPMGFGGPHAAFMAMKNEHARKMPGRIVGVSKDAGGKPAFRLAIQTREQHIKREKATSNICTAQVLLAIMASMYAVYHGPKGLRAIAERVHAMTKAFAGELVRVCGNDVLGLNGGESPFFDTIRVRVRRTLESLFQELEEFHFNVRNFGDGTIGISLDESTTIEDANNLLEAIGDDSPDMQTAVQHWGKHLQMHPKFARSSSFLTHPVFNSYHSEHEMLRYIRRLELRDISLAESMIPLGSCTMKLNGTTLMTPVTWPQFAKLHPFAPADQAAGYHEMFRQIEDWLAEITGFAATSLQPNAGSQGEYAGLLAIRAYHESRGDHERKVCLIPVSAHGTNPASAIMAGFEVAPVNCDNDGNVEIGDLKKKAEAQATKLGALMITYPSTHGVFEEQVRDICRIVHEHGGQVYMDGANMNAQVGLCRPGDIGADVCHLNLHKTFCIPHGGGGPGMGPICVAEHLRAFLPSAPFAPSEISNWKSQMKDVGPVSAAPHGSASILPISWVYIALMGPDGLKKATQVAILNANYMAKRLEHHYEVLFKGRNGRVAHEFVMDCRQFRVSAAVEVEDIAKRLMDYGFHAPTMSWPVAGTLMIEPTESESKAELDRLYDALISIREEIRAVEEARADIKDNPLKHAPHTAQAVAANIWPHAYPRELAAFPAPWLRHHKYWPPVARIDNPYGDRHLVCTCPPMESF